MRAYERCGELLRSYRADKGGRPANCPKCGINPERFQHCGYPQGVCPQKTDVAADMGLTRTDAACEAGLSDRQRVTALRIASVPKEERDELIESDDPPTVTELAARGPWRRARSRQRPVRTSAPRGHPKNRVFAPERWS